MFCLVLPFSEPYYMLIEVMRGFLIWIGTYLMPQNVYKLHSFQLSPTLRLIALCFLSIRHWPSEGNATWISNCQAWGQGDMAV